MKIYKGETGLDRSFQMPFDKETKCNACGEMAKIMFVATEYDEKQKSGKFLCDLYETTGEKGGLWLYDACSTAVYLCPHCFESTAIVNQA